MRLISCHIENFGKLHDFSMEFSDGLNVICEENGWGKSTFAAFVRAMFYGLDGDRKKNIDGNERKRYKPWQGGAFGGSLVFTINDKEYCVTRLFGDREANDEFELRDTKTNLISKDFSENLGEEIFKIDRESFLRSMFIGQDACETTTTDDINAKIGNLTDNTNDINNFDVAYSKLTEVINSLNPNRVSGSISKRKNEIANCERLVRDGKNIPDTIDTYQKYLKEQKDKYEDLKTKLRQSVENQKKVSKYEACIAKKSQWERLKRTANHAIDNALEHTMDDAQLEELLILEEYFENAEDTNEDQVEATPHRHSILNIFISLIICALAVLIGTKISLYIGIALVFVALLILVIGFIKNNNRSYDSYYDISRYEYLKMVKSNFENAQIAKNTALSELHKFEAMNNVDELINLKEDDTLPSIEEINMKIMQITELMEQCHIAIGGYNKTLDNLQEQYDEWEEQKVILEELKRLQQEEQKKYYHIATARLKLSAAKETITARYVAPILEGFSKYYSFLSGMEADNFHLDANSYVTVEEQGKQREVSALSHGYRDVVGFCLRMAFIDAMYPEEKPMIVMDDPFVNLDDRKINGGMQFLDSISKEHQIIYFTCSYARTL